MRLALYALIAVNVFDIVLHAAIGQLEPLRVTSNAIVLLSALAMLVFPAARTWWVSSTAGAIYLVLNVVFIALFTIGTLGAALIVITTALCVLTSALVSRSTPSTN